MSQHDTPKKHAMTRGTFLRGAAAATIGALGLTAGAPGRAAFAQAGGPKVTLRLAYGVTPQSALGRSMKPFADRVSQLTNGQATIEIFPAGTLLNDTQALEALQTGTLDLSQNVLLGNAAKPASVLDLPYLFQNLDHWQRAVQGRAGQMIGEEAQKVGLRALGYRVGGWRDVYTVRKQISTIADFRGLKLRTLQTASFTELFKALGAIPTPMAFGEVYLGLQQGTVDGAEGTLTSLWDAKHHEVSKFVLRTQHALTTNVLLASEIRWKTLPANVQAAIATAAREQDAVQVQDYIKDEAEIIEKVKAAGLTVTAADRAPFVAVAREKVYPAIVKTPIDQALLDEVLKA